MAEPRSGAGSAESAACDGGAGTEVDASSTPGKGSKKVLSTRVVSEVADLVDQRAAALDMTRSDLLETAVLQFLGKANFTSRKVRVEVPDEVRREVRSAQESMDSLGVQVRRIGNNVKHVRWAETAGPDEVRALEECKTELLRFRPVLDRVAGDLRVVLDRPW